MNPKSAPIRSVIDQLYRGRLPAAERALNNALDALAKGANPCAALRQSAKILRAAHWVSAMRFNDALLGAWSQFQVAAESPDLGPSVDDAADSEFVDNNESVQNEDGLKPVLSVEAFRVAISDFLDAIQYASVREFVWSSNIAKHYSTLCACKPQSVAIFVEECAGAGRVMPAAVFRTSRTDTELSAWLSGLRGRYERALCTFLNADNDEAPLDTASQEDLEACLRAWLIPENGESQAYDLGRLVKAWIHVQHQLSEASAPVPSTFTRIFNAQTRRIYALLNPLWIMKALKKLPHTEQAPGECAEHVVVVPSACVQALVISLWGMFVLYRAQSQATEATLEQIAELLADYGITTFIPKMDVQVEESASFSKALAWWDHIGLSEPQRLGVLELSQDAYQNLQTQLQYIAQTLPDVLQTAKEASAHTLLVAEEVGRLADVAYTAGLEDLAFFAEQLAMGWRYQAFLGFKARSDTLIQTAMQICESTRKMPPSLKDEAPATKASSVEQSVIDTARTTLIELTHFLLQGLEVLSDGDIPKNLTKAHQQALATVVGYR